MSTALHPVGLLGVLSSTPAGPSVARIESMPVCTASLPNLVRNAGLAGPACALAATPPSSLPTPAIIALPRRILQGDCSEAMIL